jgi:uncharacterized RDD family membrane protein YckC
MTCRHCHAVNADDIHRCFRCGRRLAGYARPAPDDYPTIGSTALDLETAPQSRPVMAVEEAPIPHIHRIEYQRPLFSGVHRVMELPVPVARPKRQNTSATRRTRTGQHAVRGKAMSQNAAQQSLEFDDLSTQESVPLIYCDAPVANPLHRAAAGFLDASMILVSLALFLVTFEMCGGEVMLSATTAPLYAGILAVLALFYKLLFCVCGSDTPGMVWTQLRLLNFDGHIPDRDERVQRMFGSFLAYTVGGLGMVWALVDEEQLAWHDHISKTFPTPYYR